jgi:hypothetical protein
MVTGTRAAEAARRVAVAECKEQAAPRAEAG